MPISQLSPTETVTILKDSKGCRHCSAFGEFKEFNMRRLNRFSPYYEGLPKIEAIREAWERLQARTWPSTIWKCEDWAEALREMVGLRLSPIQRLRVVASMEHNETLGKARRRKFWNTHLQPEAGRNIYIS